MNGSDYSVSLTGFRGPEAIFSTELVDTIAQGRAVDLLRQKGPFDRIVLRWPTRQPDHSGLPYRVIQQGIEAPLTVCDAILRLMNAEHELINFSTEGTVLSLQIPRTPVRIGGGTGSETDIGSAIVAFWRAWSAEHPSVLLIDEEGSPH